MNKKIKLFVFIIIVLFAKPVSIFSVQVSYVAGNVKYSHYQKEWCDLEIGKELNSGDIIKTEEDSFATLFDEDTEINILENTTFTVSEKYKANEKKSNFMLFLGRIKFKITKRKKEEPDISTQAVNLAIRGTEFEVASGYDGSTIVLMKEGKVAVMGKSKELLIEKGEGTEVSFGEEPTEKFEVITKVIDWDKWFKYTEESIKGNELKILSEILVKFEDIDANIKRYEGIRENSLKEKDEYIQLRDKYLSENNSEKASEYSKLAGGKSKTAFHSIVNIRFLALSSIGLMDMAKRIYSGIEAPSEKIKDTYEEIQKLYSSIEKNYIKEGDRARLENKAKKKRGCLKIF